MNCLPKAKKSLNKLKHPVEPEMIWFFLDEKIFCQGHLYNTLNNTWLVWNPFSVLHIMKTNFSQTVMVFGCVSSERDDMLLHIFEQGIRLKSDRLSEATGDCSPTIIGDSCCGKAIFTVAGFSFMLYLWKESVVLVREFLTSSVPISGLLIPQL